MAMKKPSRAIKLVGTEAPDAKGRILRAGALSAEFGNGALRYIRINDIEVLRAIAFLVRDENWGTFSPEIGNLKIRQARDSFAVSYEARCADARRSLSYQAEITATSDGALRFSARAVPDSDFLTNRTGFVVLHPLKGVAGLPVDVEHVDGKREKSRFPALINPVQPFYAIRSLRHNVMPGLSATCRMDGDTFEMEDHRNWTDASFKTYVRPLAEPWPYTLSAGVAFEQQVSLAFTGKLPRPKKAAAGRRIDIDVGRAGATLPQIGVAIPSEEASASLDAAVLIKAASPRHLVCHVDGRDSDIAPLLVHYRRLGEATGVRIVLEILLPGKASPEAELGRIAATAKECGLLPAAIAVSPAVDLKAVLPGSKGPDAPALADIYRAARVAFPGVALGGGMFSFFTELNRKRPPVELLDFVTHTTSPIVHAADDVSVMETLQALPYVIKSTRAIIGDKPYRVGPSAISARQNPYGAASAPNPDNGRVCLARMDPRQRGLFGAAWTLGYIASFARGGLEAITMGAATGPAGMIYRRADYAQPYFDDLSGPGLYPLYHLMADLGAAGGRRLIASKSGDDGAVATLGYRGAAGPVLWVANLTAKNAAVRIRGFSGPARLAMLDEGSFLRLTTDADFLKKTGKRLAKVGALVLRPYAIARLAAIAE
jgi:D-apionolactonase